MQQVAGERTCVCEPASSIQRKQCFRTCTCKWHSPSVHTKNNYWRRLHFNMQFPLQSQIKTMFLTKKCAFIQMGSNFSAHSLPSEPSISRSTQYAFEELHQNGHHQPFPRKILTAPPCHRPWRRRDDETTRRRNDDDDEHGAEFFFNFRSGRRDRFGQKIVKIGTVAIFRPFQDIMYGLQEKHENSTSPLLGEFSRSSRDFYRNPLQSEFSLGRL